MSSYSTIQISNATKNRLKALKLTPKESFENIIVRLLDVKLDGRELKYLIHTKNNKFSVKCSVDWGSDDSSILFYDDDGHCLTAPPTRDVVGWSDFVDEIYGLDNLVNILAILEEGDDIRAGGLMLKRL